MARASKSYSVGAFAAVTDGAMHSPFSICASCRLTVLSEVRSARVEMLLSTERMSLHFRDKSGSHELSFVCAAHAYEWLLARRLHRPQGYWQAGCCPPKINPVSQWNGRKRALRFSHPSSLLRVTSANQRLLVIVPRLRL